MKNELLELCHLIEDMPASTQQTELSLKASALYTAAEPDSKVQYHHQQVTLVDVMNYFATGFDIPENREFCPMSLSFVCDGTIVAITFATEEKS